jgi:hypothetical protein
LGKLLPHELREKALTQGVTNEQLLKVEAGWGAATTILQQQQSYIGAIEMAPIQVELSIRQDGANKIVITARCVRDSEGSQHAACVSKLALFEAELEIVLKELWPGCVASPSSSGVAHAGCLTPEGLPPRSRRHGVDELEPEPEWEVTSYLEPEPQLEPELEPEPEPEPSSPLQSTSSDELL